MSNFQKNFYWGAATSAHQVEGNNHNDWTEWEIENAKIKMQNAKLRSWPDFILKNYPNPLQEENYISGRACDHYNRFREDFEIAKSLGHNAHRFSLEWSRIEPEEGRFDQKEIEHYREVIRALRERGLEPFVTLWHWTMPIWFTRLGGMESPDAVKYLGRFCEKIGQEFKNEIRFFITLNEPALWAAHAYYLKRFPPAKKSFISLVHVYFKLQKIHITVYQGLKSVNPNFQIGMAENTGWFGSAFKIPFINYFRNLYFLKRISPHLDFIGLNYYQGVRIFHGNESHSDLGWEIYPKGIYYLLKYLSKLEKPIFVTENGIADARDALRPEFIKNHLYWISKAIEEGVDVRGYFHWSLLDNFEWDSGFWPRFGLVEVDYRTMERKVRESAKMYRDLISKF